MKNLVDFIVDAAKDSGLADSFESHLEDADHAGVATWLKDKGYNVHEDDCKKMMDNKNHISSSKLGLIY